MTGETGHMKSAVRDGRVIPESEARVPVSIREVFFNFSVYESVKVLKSVAVFLEDHIDRLLDSAGRLEIPHTWSAGQLYEFVYRLIKADSIDRATLRVQLIGGSSPMLFIFYTDLPAYPAEYYRRGVKVITYEGERVVPEVKSTSLLLNYVALREAERRGAFEALFVDRRGCTIEGTRTNVFALSGSTLITASSGVLAGVTRKHIIESAREIGLDVAYRCITLQDLYDGAFSEVFISSTSMGAMPVGRVDETRIFKQHQVTLRIHQLIRTLEKDYVNQA